MKGRLKLFSILTFIIGTGGVFAEDKAAPAEKKWYDKVELSGFVDVYYNHLFNNKQGNQQDYTGTFNMYNKQFAVNAVELDVEKVAEKGSPWGFRLDMQNGQNLMYQERPYSTTNSIFNMQLLQQAYVSFYLPVGKGLVIDVGKMATHIGNEVLESKDNWNYTIGYIFFNTIPFIHTGARASLTITDKIAASLYVYNSAQGTGFYNPASGYKPANDQLTSTQLTNTSYHSYNDSMNSTKAVGHQLKWGIISDKLDLVWNTLYGNDNPSGRIPNSTVWAEEYTRTIDPNFANLPGRPGSHIKYDYWFINHAMLTYSPTETLAIRLDYTHGIKSGAAAEFQGAYINNGTTSVAGQTLPFSVFRDDNKVKRIYNTYGIFIKKDFTKTFALGIRYEYLDDKKYKGTFTFNAPLATVTPSNRYDLLYQDANGMRVPSNLGQIRTFTLTPTYTWSENIIIKLDIRRDWGPGRQFLDIHGKPASYQNGLILGMVAKF